MNPASDLAPAASLGDAWLAASLVRECTPPLLRALGRTHFVLTYQPGRAILKDICDTIPARLLWIPSDLREEQGRMLPKRCHAGAVQDVMRVDRICFVRHGVGVRLRTRVRLRRCPPSGAAGLFTLPRYMRKHYVSHWFSMKNDFWFMGSRSPPVRLLVQVLSSFEVTYLQRGGPRCPHDLQKELLSACPIRAAHRSEGHVGGSVPVDSIVSPSKKIMGFQ